MVKGVAPPRPDVVVQQELDLWGAGYREPTPRRLLRELRREPAASSSPEQVYAALVSSRDFIQRLADHRVTRVLKGELRREARVLARHFPGNTDLRQLLRHGLGYVAPESTGTIREPTSTGLL